MTWQKLPGATGGAYENLTPEELDNLAERVQDAYINEAGHTEKRPGLALFKDTGTANPTDGVYWWDEGNVVIVVSGGKVFKITDAHGTTVNLTGTGIPNISTRPTFCSDGTRVFIANGGRILYTNGTALTQYIADGNAPTNVTFIAYLDGYIIANNANSQTFYWCNANDFSTWNSLNFATAEGEPDNLIGLFAGWGELMLVGRRSVERWIDDGVTPFQRLQGGLLQSGISAPYSFARVGQTVMWLDDQRRLVEMQKNDAVPVSNPFEKTIQDLSKVDDAIGDCMHIRGYPLYVLTFPLSDFTIVFNYRTKSWSRWGLWNQGTATYNRFHGNCYCYAKPWNLHLVGDFDTGKIYQASRSIFQDDGVAIRTFRRTGVNSYGSDTLKISHELRLRLHRGTGLKDAVVMVPDVVAPPVVSTAGGGISEDTISGGPISGDAGASSSSGSGATSGGGIGEGPISGGALSGDTTAGTPAPPPPPMTTPTPVRAPLMTVRWRDDGKPFGNEHQVSLGAVGDTYLYGRLLRCGKYKARQWEFVHTDNSDFILIDAEENAEATLR